MLFKQFLTVLLYCRSWQVHLLLELYRLQGNITRVKINELKPLKPRFEVPDVLVGEPPTEPWVIEHCRELWYALYFSVCSAMPDMCVSVCVSLSVLSKDDNGVVLSLGAESQRLIVSARPFRLDIMEGPEVLLSLNSRGLLVFEHLRLRKDTWVSHLATLLFLHLLRGLVEPLVSGPFLKGLSIWTLGSMYAC